MPSDSIVVQSSVLDGPKSLTILKSPLTGLARKRYQKGPGFVSVACTVQVTTAPTTEGDGMDGVNTGVIAARSGKTNPNMKTNGRKPRTAREVLHPCIVSSVLTFGYAPQVKKKKKMK